MIDGGGGVTVKYTGGVGGRTLQYQLICDRDGSKTAGPTHAGKAAPPPPYSRSNHIQPAFPPASPASLFSHNQCQCQDCGLVAPPPCWSGLTSPRDTPMPYSPRVSPPFLPPLVEPGGPTYDIVWPTPLACDPVVLPLSGCKGGVIPRPTADQLLFQEMELGALVFWTWA